MLKKVTLVLLILLLNATLLWSQETNKEVKSITYEDALKVCLENNLGVKAVQSQVKSKKQMLQAQRGMFLPRVSLSATYAMMSDDISMDMNPLKDAILPLYNAGQFAEYGAYTDLIRKKFAEGMKKVKAQDWNHVIQNKQFGSLNANLIMPIYAGGKIRASNKAASIYHKEALNEHEIVKSELSSSLVERYFGLVLAKEALNVRSEVLETMTEHMENAQKMKDEGVIPNADFLHIKVYYSQAKRDYKKAEYTIDIAEEGLSNLLSVTVKDSLLPVSALFINTDLPTLESFTSKAQTQSLLLKKVDFKKQLLKTKHGVEVQSYLPNVAVSGTYRLAHKDLSENMPKYFVGIGLQWNILDGALRFKNLQASKLQKQQVDLTYHKVEADIVAMVTKLYNEVQMYIAEYEDLKTAEDFADEYYRVRQKAFLQGFSTASEVSDANLAKAKVRIERLQAMYHYDVALAKLLYYSGQIEQFVSYQKKGEQ